MSIDAHREAPQPTSQPAPRATDARALGGLQRGQSSVVTGIDHSLDHLLRRRLHDLGFAPGTAVTCLRRAFGGTAIYQVGTAELCLRAREAAAIRIAL